MGYDKLFKEEKKQMILKMILASTTRHNTFFFKVKSGMMIELLTFVEFFWFGKGILVWAVCFQYTIFATSI